MTEVGRRRGRRDPRGVPQYVASALDPAVGEALDAYVARRKREIERG